MNRRSIFLTSLFSLALLAPIGCAVTPESEEASEETATDAEELSAAAHQLVGNYVNKAPGFGGFGRLQLKSDGKYTAKVDPAGTALCVTSPCLIPESGKWNATKRANGTYRLSVKPEGGQTRYYETSKFDASIDFTSGIIVKRNGKTETLNKLAQNACYEDADCKSNQECAPRMCLMWCEVNDLYCCGTSTCKAKTPPQPTCCDPATKPNGGIEGVHCCTDGSWQYDIGNGNGAMSCSQHGGLGNVCGGQQCGPTTCAAGTTCCNPLSGICVAPGMACAF
jgi:hypothetical protein